jgi:hypothetical protein
MKSEYWVVPLVVISVAAIMIVAPIFYFLMGALVGWIISVPVAFVGEWIIDGMALLGVELTLAQLPLFCGTLGFIGAYFVKTSSSKK